MKISDLNKDDYFIMNNSLYVVDCINKPNSTGIITSVDVRKVAGKFDDGWNLYSLWEDDCFSPQIEVEKVNVRLQTILGYKS